MRGEVVYLYAFDVANEIQFHRVGMLLGQKPERWKVRLKHAVPKDVIFHRPLVVEAPSQSHTVQQRSLRLQVHVFEVGVVCILARVELNSHTIEDMLPFRNPELADGRSLDTLATAMCADVCRELGAAIVRPAPPTEPEGYTIFGVSALNEGEAVNAWFERERVAIAGLLSGLDASRLSESQVIETLRLRWTQERDELVIIDWDAALIVDTNGLAEDVLYVLEVANLQLEEFRQMDATLDRYLNRAYDDLERRGAPTLFGSKTVVLRKLRWFRIDLTKLADEVTNITKFIGDWYLSRIYLGARERFHLDRWRGSVEQRFAQLDQIYSVVQAEISERRMLWLELIIVVFFAIDLLAILFFKR